MRSLSICIPTYNRSGYLKKTIEEIIKLDSGIPINISDNHSSDNTQGVIKEIQLAFPQVRIKYHRQKRNVGFDKNLLKSIQMSSTDFCWLLSDDDIPLKNSINKIKKILKLYPDISLIHLNYSRFDKVLQKVNAIKMVGSIKRDIFFKDAQKFYFKRINDSYFEFLGTNTITMSTNIVNR